MVLLNKPLQKTCQIEKVWQAFCLGVYSEESEESESEESESE